MRKLTEFTETYHHWCRCPVRRQKYRTVLRNLRHQKKRKLLVVEVYSPQVVPVAACYYGARTFGIIIL